MSHTILLYGATGFTGRLIAAEGARAEMAGGKGEFRMVLGARDRHRLKEVAMLREMEYRVFGLDDRDEVRRALRDVDVLINAAGPFAWTTDRLAKSAIEARCHYVDINGEVDVYKTLDDLGPYAERRQLVMVCSAGHTAAASDLLLEAALNEVRRDAASEEVLELGAVRIAMSRVRNLSRGSAETLWRSLREQVTVVRKDQRGESVLWHEPVGKLERTFDFSARPNERDLRIASAANLVDTLTARLTVGRKSCSAKRIESYVETGTAARIGYQLGTLFAPVAAIPWVTALARQQIDWLPDGPTPGEIQNEKNSVLLEIEDPVHQRIIDWRWETPNAYQFTAQVVVEIAREAVTREAKGWLTPGDVLRRRKDQLLEHDRGALRDCVLYDRLSAAEGA